MPGYEPGNEITEKKIKKGNLFEREEAYLIYVADISLLEALIGFQLLFNH